MIDIIFKMEKKATTVNKIYLVLVLALASGYAWGIFIQANRAVVRTPGHLPYYLLEAILHIAVLIFAYFNRDYILGRRLNAVKLLVINTLFGVSLVHVFGYLIK